MTIKDELKRLADRFSDKSRKAIVDGSQVIIPHKLTAEGDVVDEDSPRCDISQLRLNDLRFLEAWRDAGWDFTKACEKLSLDPAKAKRSYEKVRYFEFEDQKIKTLAKVPSTEFVAAKHVENIYTNALEDGQRDSLKELAKIVGAYKPTTNIQVNANVLHMPQLSPEQAKAAREFFDTIAEDTHAA